MLQRNVRKLLMMNGVTFRNMQSANFRINTYEKVHLLGLFIQTYFLEILAIVAGLEIDNLYKINLWTVPGYFTVTLSFGMQNNTNQMQVTVGLATWLRGWKVRCLNPGRRQHIFLSFKIQRQTVCNKCPSIKLLKPTGQVMHQQINIQQLYVLPTLYLCVLYLSENKQRLVPFTA